jgi:hypothetical protein
VIDSHDANRMLQVEIPIASGKWRLVVTPLPTDNSFEIHTADIIFIGVMWFFGTIALAVFLWRNMRQMEAIHHAKQQAEAERKIIAGLYPENVIQRLLSDEKARQKALKNKKRLKGKVFDGKIENATALTSSSDPSFETLDPMTMMMMTTQQHPTEAICLSLYGSNPIADHFEETTILFADLVSPSTSKDQANGFFANISLTFALPRLDLRPGATPGNPLRSLHYWSISIIPLIWYVTCLFTKTLPGDL